MSRDDRPGERDDGEAEVTMPAERIEPGDLLWQRNQRLPWHVAMVGIYVLTMLVIMPGTGPHDWPSAVWVAAAALTVVALAYAVLVTSSRATMGGPRVMTYLTVMVVGESVAIAAEPGATLFLFIAFTHVWALTGSRRIGTIYAGALAVGMSVALAAGNPRVGWPLGVVVGTVSFVFAIAMGWSILALIARAQERSRLATELTRAQHQLAEARWAETLTAQRERIAQDIHDTLAQGFTSIVMLAQVASADVESGRGTAATDRLDLIERTARENLAEARALVAAHAPIALAADGLDAAIRRLGSRFEAETGVAVVVELPEGRSVADDARAWVDAMDGAGRAAPGVAGAPSVVAPGRDVVLLRACQEALANVRKHAEARHVEIHLDHADDGDRLTVRDDGRGIPGDFVPGIGLESMAVRAGALGGSLRVGAAPDGTGTILDLWLPRDPEVGAR